MKRALMWAIVAIVMAAAMSASPLNSTVGWSFFAAAGVCVAISAASLLRSRSARASKPVEASHA
jgi:membrane protein implicated in regulation of membrane protease activity